MEENNLHGKYLHYKGKYYDVLGEARDINTKKEYIIYRQSYGRRNWWIRPKDMFFDEIILNGKVELRFNKINNETEIPDLVTRPLRVRHTETGESYLLYYKRILNQYCLLQESQRGEQMNLEMYFDDFEAKNNRLLASNH